MPLILKPLAGGPLAKPACRPAGAPPRMPAAEPPRSAPKPPPFHSLSFPPDRMVLSVTEVAARLQVTTQHVIDLIDEGKLRALNVGGQGKNGRKSYRVPTEAWEDFLRANAL